MLLCVYGIEDYKYYLFSKAKVAAKTSRFATAPPDPIRFLIIPLMTSPIGVSPFSFTVHYFLLMWSIEIRAEGHGQLLCSRKESTTVFMKNSLSL